MKTQKNMININLHEQKHIKEYGKYKFTNKKQRV